MLIFMLADALILPSIYRLFNIKGFSLPNHWYSVSNNKVNFTVQYARDQYQGDSDVDNVKKWLLHAYSFVPQGRFIINIDKTRSKLSWQKWITSCTHLPCHQQKLPSHSYKVISGARGFSTVIWRYYLLKVLSKVTLYWKVHDPFMSTDIPWDFSMLIRNLSSNSSLSLF